MSLRGFLKELHHRNVFKVAVAYTAAAVVLLEVLTHLFHNFEAPLRSGRSIKRRLNVPASKWRVTTWRTT